MFRQLSHSSSISIHIQGSLQKSICNTIKQSTKRSFHISKNSANILSSLNPNTPVFLNQTRKQALPSISTIQLLNNERFYSSDTSGSNAPAENIFLESRKERRIRYLTIILAIFFSGLAIYFSIPDIHNDGIDSTWNKGLNAIIKKQKDIETLTELIKKIEKGETVEISLLHRLLNDVALPIGKEFSKPIILSAQKNFFLEHPLAWELMLDIAINDTNPKKRLQFTNLIRILAYDTDLAESISKSSLNVIVDLLNLDLPRSESAQSALQIFRILLCQRSTHPHFTAKEAEKLEKLLSNNEFYNYFREDVLTALSTPLPADKSYSLVVNNHPRLRNVLLRKSEETNSTEQLKILLESDVAIKKSSITPQILYWAPVFLIPLLYWRITGKRTKWAFPNQIYKRSTFLLLSLIIGSWGISRAPPAHSIYPLTTFETRTIIFYLGVLSYLLAIFTNPIYALSCFLIQGSTYRAIDNTEKIVVI